MAQLQTRTAFDVREREQSPLSRTLQHAPLSDLIGGNALVDWSLPRFQHTYPLLSYNGAVEPLSAKKRLAQDQSKARVCFTSSPFIPPSFWVFIVQREGGKAGYGEAYVLFG
ncbi:hypothetical protein AOLI_G00291770 [Acnodon oligacanthus]